MKELKQRVAIITGAASGIGRATALALAQSGCRCALVDLDETGLEETRRLVTTAGGEAQCHLSDVSNVSQMQALAEKVLADFHAVHILVNNAGINVTASFEEHSLEDFHRVMSVNLLGVVNGCHVFLPYLREVDEAHIVNISSIFGIVGVAGQTAYSASKFAVRGFTEALEEELKGSNVGVSVVYPGCINTNIIHSATIYEENLRSEAANYFQQNGLPPDAVARRILRAIRHNEPRVRITVESYLFDWLRRLAPITGNRLANSLMQRLVGVDDITLRARRRP